MTDKNVALEASDAFDLGGNFIPQKSAVTSGQEHTAMIKADGQWQKWSSVFNLIDRVTCDYKFNAVTGLGDALPSIGAVHGGYLVDEVIVASVYNDWPIITVNGHQHEKNIHVDGMTTFTIPAAVRNIITGAMGSYDYFSKSGGDICDTDSTISLNMNHLDAECDEAGHWVGTNLQGRLEATVNYLGLVLSPLVVSGWTVISCVQPNDSNSDFDRSSITAEYMLDPDA